MVVNGRATVTQCVSGTCLRLRFRCRAARVTHYAFRTCARARAEVGIFGVYVGDGETVHMNEYGGYLMRTKVRAAAAASCFLSVRASRVSHAGCMNACRVRRTTRAVWRADLRCSTLRLCAIDRRAVYCLLGVDGVCVACVSGELDCERVALPSRHCRCVILSIL